MTEPSPTFTPDPEDLAQLVDRIGSGEMTPPWSLPELSDDEAHALLLLLAAWVDNHNLGVADPRHLIPPCWPRHRGLMEDLAILCWQYWAVTAPGASVDEASVWAERWLPGFHLRLADHTYGTWEDCRSGQHKSAPALGEAEDFRKRRGETLTAIADVLTDSGQTHGLSRDPLDAMPTRPIPTGAAPPW